MEVCDQTNTLNFSHDGDVAARALLYSVLDQALIVIFIPVIVALGLFTNVSFLVVVARVPRMQTVTNIYLAQLATADLLFLVLAETEKLVFYWGSPVALDMSVMGFGGSVAINFFIQLLHAETMILVTVVALEKYHTIFKPLDFRAHWTQGNRRRALKVSVLTWVLAAGVVSLEGPWMGDYVLTCITWPDSYEFTHAADHVHTLKIVSGMVTAYELVTVPLVDSLVYTITFIVIASVNLVLFVRIVRALTLRVEPVSSRSPMDAVLEARLVRTRNQVAWMLVVNGVVFYVLMAPRKIYDLARTVAMSRGLDLLDHRQHSILLSLFNIMMYMNSAVNPIVYSVVSPRYRCAFRRAFSFSRRQTLFAK